MDSVLNLLHHLADKGVKLDVEDGRLSCYAPAGALTRDLRESLTRNKREIVSLLLSEPAGAVETQRYDRFPLSLGQKGLYILQSLDPASSVYNVPICLQLSNALDVGILQRAWSLVLKKFPILTSRVGEFDGELLHTFDRAGGAPIARKSAGFADRQEMLAFMRQRFEEPFDLQNGPLTRCELYTIDQRYYQLLITVHHIVFDGASIVILLNTLFDYYRSLLANPDFTVEPSAVGYASFVAWEADLLDSAEGKRHAEYWRAQLAGGISGLQLTPDFSNANAGHHRGRMGIFELSPELARRVRDLSTEHSIRPSAIFFVVYQLLLQRYSDQPEFAIGMPVMGRAASEFAFEVGYFINMVPLRCVVTNEASIRSLLKSSQATMLDAVFHSTFPFPLIVRQMNLELSKETPVFQVSFAYQNFIDHVGMPSLPMREELDIEYIDAIAQDGEFDLGVEVYETPGGFNLHLKHNANKFSAATIDRMYAHFCRVIGQICDNPDRPVRDISLVDGNERQKLLSEFAVTPDAVVAPKALRCLHDYFNEQAGRYPEKIALRSGHEQLSYRELQGRSVRLAAQLQSLGVNPGVVVGLCVDRPVDTVVGMLAILQAGGAYLPLAPNYPDERLAFMLGDTDARLVLTQAELAERIRAFVGPEVAVVALDGRDEFAASGEELGEARESRLRNDVMPDDLAYVIYTSGSTGRPKGVLTTHANVALTVRRPGYVEISPDDVVVSLSKYIFDGSVFDIFAPLCNGACLSFVDDVLDPDALEEALGENTVVFMTTALFNTIVNMRPGILNAPKAILFGGEQVSVIHVKKALRVNPNANLIHVYGPTETTVFASYYPIDRSILQEDALKTVPIGFPLAHTRLYVLDKYLEPQSVGVPGELYIGGDKLARGYLNRPELTSNSFIADPFRPGGRMYKTGDIVRWLDGGQIEFIGRIDTQVKMRGFRIEIGEIEAEINGCPRVRDCAVVVQGADGRERLVAFYVLAHDAGGIADVEGNIRNRLGQTLPEYMVPSVFAELDALPLTPTKKVDRKALQAQTVSPGADRKIARPSNAAETALAGIWSELLGVDAAGISVHDSFLSLGGHSLLATQMVSRIRDELNVELSIRDLFENTTIAQLAAVTLGKGNREAVTIQPVDRSSLKTLPLSFAQERLWFIDQLDPGNVGYNVPGAARIRGAFDIDLVERALNLIVARHENLRTIFPSVDGSTQQKILDRLEIKVQRVDLSNLETTELREQKAREIGHAAATLPFDLSAGPLLRCAVVKLAATEHVLILNMHHIVSDGWSLGVLIDEFRQIIEAWSAGTEPVLAPLAIQYVDFSVWQRRWLQADTRLREQLSYWSGQLAGVEGPIGFTPDYSRPGVQSFKGEVHRFEFDQELSGRLNALSERHDCTLFMTLLAALSALIYRSTGQRDICVGSPIANRQNGQTERLIGMFVNALALRNKIDDDDSFLTLLDKVKNTCLNAYENQDAPFEKIVEQVKPDRDLALSPIFQTVLALQNAPMDLTHDDRIEAFPLETGIAKFDMTFEFTETPQGLAGSVEFCTGLYKAETVHRLVGHFRSLCLAVVADPGREIDDIDYMDDSEKKRLLFEFNATGHDYGPASCLHSLVHAQAVANPDRTALDCADRTMSYGQLDELSEDLALFLQDRGVEPDRRVGLCIAGSFEMVVGMLGTLRAGGAYVPLDPNAPDERLTHMLTDCAAQIVLTIGAYRNRLSDIVPAGCQVVVLDGSPSAIGAQAAQLRAAGVTLRTEVAPHHLAYVIYTSGSTGQPKGVMVQHDSLQALCCWHRRAFEVDRHCRATQIANLAFDAAGWELWPYLVNGASVHLLPCTDGVDVTLISAIVRDRGITHCFLVTPVAEEFLKIVDARGTGLRYLLLGGDSLRSYEDRDYSFEVINNYGPTEATVVSTSGKVVADASGQRIGRPIDNTRVYVLDEKQKPQPIGVPGELFMAGAGLARGYLNREGLTRRHFVANPFEPGRRMYKSGDLARWLDDGTLEFLGRKDTQVKIRGFRIEIGEIEHQLNRHPQMAEAVVVLQDRDTDPKLVAFYVAADVPAAAGEPVSRKDLEGHLRERLPEYMVPAAFVLMPRIPLTANGKVDRRALQKTRPAATSSTGYVGPRSDDERAMVSIWSQVLGRPESDVGTEENFFELGGHSLLAVRLMARINAKFGYEIPLAQLFVTPTIRSLTEFLNEFQQGASQILVPIQPHGAGRPIFAVPGTGGSVLSFAPLARALGRTRPFYGLQALGLDGRADPPASVEATASANVEALQTVQETGPYVLLGHSYGGVVAYAMARTLLAAGHPVAALYLVDSLAPAEFRAHAAQDEGTQLIALVKTLARRGGMPLAIDRDALLRCAQEEDLDAVARLLNDQGLDVSAGQLANYHSLYLANDRCYRAYDPAPLSGSVDVSLFRSDATRKRYPTLAADYGWTRLLSEAVTIRPIDAGHFSILEGEAAMQISQVIGPVDRFI